MDKGPLLRTRAARLNLWGKSIWSKYLEQKVCIWCIAIAIRKLCWQHSCSIQVLLQEKAIHLLVGYRNSISNLGRLQSHTNMLSCFWRKLNELEASCKKGFKQGTPPNFAYLLSRNPLLASLKRALPTPSKAATQILLQILRRSFHDDEDPSRWCPTTLCNLVGSKLFSMTRPPLFLFTRLFFRPTEVPSKASCWVLEKLQKHWRNLSSSSLSLSPANWLKHVPREHLQRGVLNSRSTRAWERPFALYLTC